MIGRALVVAAALAGATATVGGQSTEHTAPGAALDRGAFAYARPIPPGSGLSAIRLDAAALAHGRLDDLRILDARGRQVPYVVERISEPLTIELPAPAAASPRRELEVRNVPDAATRTWYAIALPYAGLPDATLRLSTTSRVFTRDVVVVSPLTARDAPRALDPFVARARWSHESPDSAAPALALGLGARLRADTLFALIDDGDNRPLALAGASLSLPTYRLRFFRQESPLTLVYGHPTLAAPRYDLALLEPTLNGAEATEVVAGPESVRDVGRAAVGRWAFWAILSLAVVVLIGLIARLLLHPGRSAD